METLSKMTPSFAKGSKAPKPPKHVDQAQHCTEGGDSGNGNCTDAAGIGVHSNATTGISTDATGAASGTATTAKFASMTADHQHESTNVSTLDEITGEESMASNYTVSTNYENVKSEAGNYSSSTTAAHDVGGAPSSNPSTKPHTGSDVRWEAINVAKSRDGPLGLSHFRLLKRLGYGDIGSVYLVELRDSGVLFAMKVMDRASLESRNKLLRAQTEREILCMLDHPFLPTLYSHFETDKFYCLVMEYCSGGNLHSLRQKQTNKYFTEDAARFYATEVLLALEYLHMLGIVYRDLKPENVLVREEGHIMLSDFDLSLRCSVSPTLVKSSSVHVGGGGTMDGDPMAAGCIQPSSFFPRLLPRRSRKTKSDMGLFANGSLPELMAEPTHARSMSFVGTHEYLAPEIIRGEGHGSAVDWWTFGIFLYELLHGITPFKGTENRATLCNVVGQPLRFPDTPTVSLAARDLIKGLLVKDPQRRIAYKRGATEIKQHPFFEGVNWALVRCTAPPQIPEPTDMKSLTGRDTPPPLLEKKSLPITNSYSADDISPTRAKSTQETSHLDFECF